MITPTSRHRRARDRRLRLVTWLRYNGTVSMETYRGRPSTMPSYTQLRLENEKLRRQLADALGADGLDLAGDQDRANALEGRLQEVQAELTFARQQVAELRRQLSVADAEPAPAYDSWLVADLQAELDRRGLATTGKKSELVDRLSASDPA